MKLRPLLVSLAVLAPLAAIAWWLGKPAAPASSADPRLGQSIANAEHLAAASRLEIKASGASLAFTRNAAERWIIDGTPALPADVSRLAGLSKNLVTSKIERLVSARPEKIATFELDQSSVVFTDPAGKSILDLQLGKTAEGGGRIFRYGEEPRAYLARLDLTVDTSASSWRDTALFSGLKAEDVSSFSISFPPEPGAVTFSREKSDQPWTSANTPDGHTIKASSLASQAGNLTTLRYTDVKPNFDPDVVAARVFPREVTFTTFGGRTVTLGFYRLPEPPAPAASKPEEGDATPPPSPAPRPVYAAIISDSAPDTVLAEVGKTHTFEIAEWLYNALPASRADLFEPGATPSVPAATSPAPNSAGENEVSATTPPVSVPQPAAD